MKKFNLKIFFIILFGAFFCVSSYTNSDWVQTNGPIGGNVRCLSYSNGNLYAGSMGGVFKSSNNGTNWFPVNNGLQYLDVRSISAKGDTIFAGLNLGIFRSTNGCDSWVYSGLPGSTSISILIYNNIVFTTTLSELQRSTDWGNTWDITNWANGTINTLYVKDNLIFAGTSNSGIYVSSDAGLSWNYSGNGLTNQSINSLTSKDNLLFAGSAGGGVFRSNNNGNNWEQTNNGIFFFNIIALHTLNSYVFASSYEGGIYCTSDNGNNWIEINSGLQDYHIWDFISIGNNLFAGSIADGIYSSTNYGEEWTVTNNGILSHQINELKVVGNYLFAGSAFGGIFRSSDNGNSWQQLNAGIYYHWYSNAFLYSGNRLFTGVESGIFSTTNYGNYWQNMGMPQYNVTCFVECSGNIFAGTYNQGLFRSTDQGNSWQPSGHNNESVFQLLTKDSTLLASTTQGLFTSTNCGNTWFLRDQNFQPFSFTVCNNIIYGGYAGVKRSTNNGIYWISAGLNGKFINSLISIDSLIIAGTHENGVFISSDKGVSWIDKSQGLLDKSILSLAVKDNYLFAGTGGSSIWKRPLNEIIGIRNISNEIPVKFRLFQNYPNPFNPSTTIRFNIPVNHLPLSGGDPEGVNLKIYDILGNEIAVLVNGKLAPGTYEYQWDATAFPSGVYFYKLKAGDFSAVNKMVLIR